MILNQIPCLDKGYVAKISSHNDGIKLLDIANEFLNPAQRSDKLFVISSLTLIVKCPLFCQLNLSQFGFDIINTKPLEKLEAYIPHPGEISGNDLEVSREMSENMRRTTEALFMNPIAYQADGCDRFISQVIIPVNTYTTVIVHGSYNQWQKYMAQQNLPSPLEAYRLAVKQIVDVEWEHGTTKRLKEQDSK